MASARQEKTSWKRPPPTGREAVDEWGYPSGMVWCPMKMSGMALMKCAEMQKRLGCGTLRQFKILATTKPDNITLYWPWLKRNRECRARANEKDVRELRVALSPLKLVKKPAKTIPDHQCPQCGGRKASAARLCRQCRRCTADR